MNEIVAIVEGETEQTFVRDQLAAHLACLGNTIWAVLPGRNRRRGGVKKWEVAKNDILRTLRERRFCTTMFDYYAMPTDWPGRVESAILPWEQRADHVESLVLAEVTAAMDDSFDPRFFIPYVQLHEFEAYHKNRTCLSKASSRSDRDRPHRTECPSQGMPALCRLARSS